MNVTAVESTTLSKIAYDDIHSLLQLEFRSRSVYQYFDVPPAVHAALLDAPSKGTYFNQTIRGRYRYTRVTEGDASAQPMHSGKSACSREGGQPWHAR